MRLGLGIGVTLTGRRPLLGGVGAVVAFFPSDGTALTDAFASTQTDNTFRGPNDLFFGYSKSGGRFGLAALDPSTGAVRDARILLNDPALYAGMNDHFMVAPWVWQNGPHAGTLYALTVPHGPQTVNGGGNRFYARYSKAGTTQGLIPAGNGGPDYIDCGSVHNLGNYQERSDGRLVFLTGNDQGTPQFYRFLYTDDPAVLPKIGRSVVSMEGQSGSGGNAQLYTNAVPGEQPNTMRVMAYIHPSVPDQPLKTFLIDLTAGTVLVGGQPQGTGSIYDTTGDRMLAFGNAPTIMAASGNIFTRMHSVCESGAFKYGRAVGITQGAYGSSLSAGSHKVLYCPAPLDMEVLSNWQTVTIGAAGRARPWDNGNNRRYNSDIQFLPVRGTEAMRVLIIAYEAGQYRTEIWAGDPANLQLVGVTPLTTSPRPIRAYRNPGAATDNVLAVETTFTSYTAYTDYVSGPVGVVKASDLALPTATPAPTPPPPPPPPPSTDGADAATQAYIARMETAPNSQWADLYKQTITSLFSAGLWDALDAYYLLGGHTRQASLLNLKGTAYTASQAGGMPDSAFAPGQGWQGGTGYIETGFLPTASGVKFLQNSGHLGLFSRTPAKANVTDMGNILSRIICQNVDSVSPPAHFSVRINGSQAALATNPYTGAGHFLANRVVADNVRGLRNGELLTGQQSAVPVSEAPDANTIIILGRTGSTTRSPRLSPLAHIGGGLTPAQEMAASNIANTFASAAAGMTT